MPTVRYTAGGRYRVAGHTFEPGDEADISDGLADHLVDTGAFTVVGGDGSQPWPPEDYIPSKHTVAEIREGVAEIDDPEQLERLAEAEEAGENRTTALEAIDDRLAELGD